MLLLLVHANLVDGLTINQGETSWFGSAVRRGVFWNIELLLSNAFPFLQHGHVSGNYMSSQKMQHKKNVKSKEYDDYSHYSDENFGNYNEEEKDEDFADQLKQYRQAKETSSSDLGPPFPKEPVKKQGMKGLQKGKIMSVVSSSKGWVGGVWELKAASVQRRVLRSHWCRHWSSGVWWCLRRK